LRLKCLAYQGIEPLSIGFAARIQRDFVEEHERSRNLVGCEVRTAEVAEREQ
jgi:hypothetical protein